MSRLFGSAALLALVAVAPTAVRAQSSSGPNFNIAAGVSLPTGNFSNRNDAGYNIIVGIGAMERGSPLGFRAEGIYNEFNQKLTSDKSRAGGVTANLIYDLVAPNSAQNNTLYLTGGIGYYSTRDRFESESQSNVGWNLGGGFKFPLSGFSAYLEARYHAVSNTSVKFIPMSFGLVF